MLSVLDWALGAEFSAPGDLGRLADGRQALGMIERGPHGEPVLTAHGWKTQSRIESGLAVPEFDADEAI